MRSSPRLREAGRLAAVAAVGLVLGGSVDQFCYPADDERVSFDVASDCGPAGRATFAYDGGGLQGCGRCDAFVDGAGAAALGLPDRGELVDGPADAEGRRVSRGIAAGDFVLAGPVAIPGAVPALTVDRICRLGAGAAPGTLELSCTGPEPEAACAGTLTAVPEAP